MIADFSQFYKDHLQYLYYGKEICPTTGTPHLQGWMITRKEQTFKTMLAMVPHSAHLSIMKGNELENLKYCSKDTDVFTEGVINILVPNIEQVVLIIKPHLTKSFFATTTTELFKAVRVHKKDLMKIIRDECPVQYIRHRIGIKHYLDDIYDEIMAQEIFYAEREYFFY